MKEKLRSNFNRRQYMLARDFEIYYYNDRTFKNVVSHAHDYYEFYVFLEGNVDMEIGEVRHPLKKGDIVVVPPRVKHRAYRKGEGIYRRFVFWISQEFANSLGEQSSDYVWLMQKAKEEGKWIGHLDPADFNTVETRILRLLEETRGSHFGKDAAMLIAAEDLVLCLNRFAWEASAKKKGTEEDLFTRMVQYIDTNIAEDLSLDAIAAHFFVSKYYADHLFTNTLGISLHRYITKKRLQHCRNEMLSGEPVTAAYLNAGFRDYSSFFRSFRKEYGMSPREYKTMHQARS